MAKKKTRVMLPGGIQGLVHDLQNGTSRYAQQPIVDSDRLADENLEAADDKATETNISVQTTDAAATTEGVQTSEQQTNDSARAESVPATQQADEKGDTTTVADNAPMREYHIVKDDSKDSWDLFVDMARQYKSGGGKLATIYIDETLKSVLDRMKYAGPEKLSTSAILSSIVARFIYDHEDEIRKVLFSGDLL